MLGTEKIGIECLVIALSAGKIQLLAFSDDILIKRGIEYGLFTFGIISKSLSRLDMSRV